MRMPDPLPINEHLTLPGFRLVYEFSRSGGPGGQHVNTTDTRVRLRFDLAGCQELAPSVKHRIERAERGRITEDGELLVVADNNRSRQRNIDDARQRLVEIVRAALVPPKVRRATKPSLGAKKRRVKAKKERAQVKSTRGKVDREE